MIRQRLTASFFRKWRFLLIGGVVGIYIVALILYFRMFLVDPSGLSESIRAEQANQAQLQTAILRLETLTSQINTATDPAQAQQLQMERVDLLSEYILRTARGNDLSAKVWEQSAWIRCFPLYSLISVLIGTLIMLTVAYQLEYREGTFRTTRQVESALEAPLMGILPAIRGGSARLIHLEQNEGYAPAYQKFVEALPDDQSLIWVTSPGAGEGKSLTCANLGIALAQTGRPTLIIDADLRTPTQHRLFKLSNREGLANLIYQYVPTLHGQLETLSHTYIKPTEIENLSVLTTGPLPAQPSDALGLPQTAALFSGLADRYTVLIDAPTPLIHPDLLPIAAVLTGAVLLIDSRRSRRRAAKRGMGLLRQLGVKWIGVVFNRGQAG
jgi:capsular exopolysaccharide synthesis family protein